MHQFELRTSDLRGTLHDCEAGLSGFRALVHADQGDNILFPGMGGLNLEYIFDSVQPQSEVFEPRQAPMRLEPVSEKEAVLHQEATPFWRLESHTTYRMAPPHYVDLAMEFIPRAAVAKSDYLGVFWCSYMNEPQDNRLHFVGRETGSDRSDWVHASSPQHKVRSAFYHSDEQARRLATSQPSPVLALNEAAVRYAKPFYYGLRGQFVFIMMFKDAEHTAFAHSPSAGFPGDPRHPAWDFAFLMDNPQVGRPYRFEARLAYKRFAGPNDVAAEWSRWASQ